MKEGFLSRERILQTAAARVWAFHAAYFLIGGIWSVVGRRSFEAVSGRKTDYWLVRTVGGLLTAVGAVIGLAGIRRRVTPEVVWLGISTSAALTAIDIIYTAKRRISPVYLLDAVVNIVLIGAWIVSRLGAARRSAVTINGPGEGTSGHNHDS
jgi:hypothetical protein